MSESSPEGIEGPDAIKAATVAIAIAAFIQVIVTWSQWAAMNKGLEQSERTIAIMQRAERPWLTAVGLEGKMSAGDNSEIKLYLKLKNCGNTPATLCKGSASCVARPPGVDISDVVDKAWNKANQDYHSIIIGPQQVLSMSAGNDEFFKSKLASMNDGTLDCYLIAVYEYDGVGGGNYAGSACFKYHKEYKEFRLHDEYNRLDVPPNERGN